MAEEGTTTDETTSAPPASNGSTPGNGTHWSSMIEDTDLRAKYSQDPGRYPTITDFARSNTELERRLGEGSIKPLGENPTPEEVQAWRKSVHGDAYPDAADGYTLEMPAIPESMGPISEEMVHGFTQRMHAAGATTEQVQAALNYWGEVQSQGPELQRAEFQRIDEANEAYFTTRWGSQAQNNLRIAAESARRDGGQEALDLLFEVGDNGNVKPTQAVTFLYEALYDYGMTHGHHKFVITDSSGGFVRPENAASAADELMADHAAGKITDQEYDRRMSDLMKVSQEGNIAAFGGGTSIGVSDNG